MKLINSSVEILDSDWSLKGIFRAIERAGRTCYKSVGTRYFRLENEPKNEEFLTLISNLENDSRVVCKKGPFFDDSYYVSIPNKFIRDYPALENYWEEEFEDCAYYENLTADDFVDMLIKSGHGAMLEHGTVYLDFLPGCYENRIIDSRPFSRWEKYASNKYSYTTGLVGNGHSYVTTNFRVIIENKWEDDLIYLCEPTEYHPLRITAKFICDRGVSHEIVRHRAMSFAQESQRYCNYSKDKYNNEVTFITPSFLNIESEQYNPDDIQPCANSSEEEKLLYYLSFAEAAYLELINTGYKPQQARYILPNATKTEIVVTGFVSDWKHFFELRCSERAHPDIKVLALDLKNQFENRNLI